MAGLEATQLPGDDAFAKESEVEQTALELDLKGLSFKEKWDVIGAATPAAFLRTEAPASPLTGWNHEAMQFQGMVASVKLNNCDLSRRSAVRAAASLPLPEYDVRRQLKYLRETGSPFRFHCKAPDRQTQMNNGSMPRPDHIGNVEQGLEDMWERYDNRFSRPQTQQSLKSMSASSRRSRTFSRSSLRQPSFFQAGSPPASAAAPNTPQDRMATMVMLSEFSRWCIDNFDDGERAWNTLNPAGNGVLSQEDFSQALRRCGYPEADNAEQELFNSLAENKALTEKSFYNALDSVSVGRTLKRQTTAVLASPAGKTLAGNDIDPIEALATGGDGVGSSLVNTQREIIERLKRTDAPVAEAIEYFFDNFGTLKLAFRQLDINGNGLLSSQEFVDGMVGLKSKASLGPIQVHAKKLFLRLNYDGKGSMTLEDLVANLEKDSDPMVARLLKFTQEVKKRSGRRGTVETDKVDDASKLRQYARMFQVGNAHSTVTGQGFCDALAQLRYPTWHAADLFRRLDKDDSGELSLGEFTAFLQKDPPVRIERKGPVKPLGSEHRKSQVEQMYISCATSSKLESNRRQFSSEASPLHKLMARGDAKSNKFLVMGTPFDTDGTCDKPDWIAHVNEGLLESREERTGSRFMMPKATELARYGSHVLRVHSASAPDLVGTGCITASFNDKEDRCHISAF